MNSKIDTVREALDEIQKIKWLIDEGPAHVKLTEAQDRLTKLKAALSALSAIDPEAKIVVVQGGTCGCTSCPMYPKVPIFGAQPAWDDRLKPSDYDDEDPCASCRADYPADCEECEMTDAAHVDSMWRPKPARDAGEPSVCYRLNKRPTEKLFDRLETANFAIVNAEKDKP